ncbi:sigma-70 family RNA polymerase sigma factor [Streptomyces sp. RB110-1]|uniref:RNA polymerase sigma factor n=2 Tax=Streptomyces TaxID=1883 RepID=UPI001901446D|nr:MULTISPECIES: sigma-70 family RNA polymerase sigma factor [unclassified Streptomyces]MBK0372642.1 sigma-70 family RNA polymerase sigma factor [Streptomyces sp. RB110-1]MBK0384632.1 sigma-70 family RNA polymerase sigma factor [Streptomyces sp. RB110-2]
MHHDQPDGASLPRGDLPTADGHPDLPLYQASALADTDEIQRSLSEAATQDAQRITEDAAAYDMLAAADFSGIAWELMADTLAAYAYPVAMNWLYTGEIVTLCAARQRPVTRTPHDWDALTADHDEREELVCETIARALRTFREHALIKGRWSPKGGASLKTYFIGAVLGEFSAVYSRWASERSRRPPCIPDGMESLQALPADHRTTEDEIIGRTAVRTFLVGITDETTRTAVVLSMMGYSRQEVGEHLNMSAAAVTMRLSRLRRKRPPHQSSPSPESPDPSTDKEARG